MPILITRTAAPFTSRQAIFGLIAVLVIALSVGAIVAVVVARSMREQPAPSSLPR